MDHAQASPKRASTAYQVMLVTLLSLNFGIVFFDRNALNFLMPFVKPELGLNNTQVGILARAPRSASATSPTARAAARDC